MTSCERIGPRPEATLYGSWGGAGGTVVPGGTVAVDGEYLIQDTDRFRRGHPKNIYIHFESTSPIFNALFQGKRFAVPSVRAAHC
jgi:hypothetical protein